MSFVFRSMDKAIVGMVEDCRGDESRKAHKFFKENWKLILCDRVD